MNSSEIIFDEKQGISIEEQQEILYQINGITEKNRKSLAETANTAHEGSLIVVNARKKVSVFPLAVNISAFLILAAGILSLSFLYQRKDLQIREGTGVYSTTEQALIGELTAAQQEAFLILEQLARDQEKAVGIDAYLSGAIAVATELILNNEFDRAAESIGELFFFLNTASFETNRVFLLRKEFYIQSVLSVEKLVDDIRKSGLSYVMALEAKNTDLEENVLNMTNTIETLTAGNAEHARRIAQLENTVSEKDRSISSLETERSNLTQTVFELRTANTTQEATITQLNEQLANIRQALQALSQ